MNKVPMTSEGYATLEAELKRLKQVERPRILQAISEARAHGDLSENAEYHAAKEAQGMNEARVAELEDKLGRAEVIDISKLDGDTVTFGAIVKLLDEETENERVYRIVGDLEADVKDGKISVSSPIARALIGKKIGDSVEVYYQGQLAYTGRDTLRDRYRELFENAPRLHATVLRRDVDGDTVVDHERVLGIPNRDVVEAVATYEVEHRAIKRVRFQFQQPTP
jgi:transcription elongation factor GreA